VLLTTASFFRKKDVNLTEFVASVQVLKPVVRSRLVRVVAGLSERRPRPLWSPLRAAKSTSILSGNEPNRTTTTRKIMYPSAQGGERTPFLARAAIKAVVRSLSHVGLPSLKRTTLSKAWEFRRPCTSVLTLTIVTVK
jgi:hypothetical protein